MLWVKLHRSSLSSFANLNCIVGTKLKNKKIFQVLLMIDNSLTNTEPVLFSLCVLGSVDGKPVSYTWVLPSICAEIPTSKYHYFILHSWIPHRHLFIIAAYRWRPLTRTGNPGCEFETILRKTLQKLWTNSETKWSQLWLIWLCLEYFLPFYTIPMRNRLINQVWFRIHLCLKL